MSNGFDPVAYLKQASPSGDAPAAFDPIAHLANANPTTEETVVPPSENAGGEEVESETGAAEAAVHYLSKGVVAPAAGAAGYVAGLLPGMPGSMETAGKWANALTYDPRTEQGKGAVNAINKMGATAAAAIPADPLQEQWRKEHPESAALIEDVKQRMLTLAGGVPAITGLRALSKAGGIGSLIEQGHPLTQAAQSEVDRMAGHIASAKAKGLDLEPRIVSPAQNYVDDAARRDLDLAGNSPITSGMLDAADKQNVSPHYSAAHKFAPELVQASQQGRSVARGLFEDAGNMNLTFAQRSAARTEAQTNYQTAKDAEAEFRAKATAAGQPNLADNWDKARVYKAKLETWRDALQGGVEGHVNGLRIRKLGLADEPLTGPQAEAASVAAQHPDQFTSGVAAQRPGPVGRLIKKAAPIAGAAAGGWVAPGVIGPAVGAELAGSLADRFIR